MNYIIDFYKSLDTVNLIIFWGVIIVVLLLLIFSTIIANKNRKLEKIIEENGIDIDNDDIDNDLAIKKITDDTRINDKKNDILEENTVKEEIEKKDYLEEEITRKVINEMPVINNEVSIKENKFIAEEHVKEYNQDFFEIPTIKKQSEYEHVTEKISDNITMPKIENNNTKEAITSTEIPEIKKTEAKEIISERPTAPYQRNILREVYPSQTSPIGATRTNMHVNNEIDNAKELNAILNNIPENNHQSNENNKSIEIEKRHNYINQAKTNNVETREPAIQTQPPRKGNYLEELSKKMSEANDINRTSYELQQEQDAIISYKELMQKKEQIKIVDEEDAIISIEELQKRKLEEEKLYNITEKEPNDDFINELKNFRSDL